jgi:hypothetical protein
MDSISQCTVVLKTFAGAFISLLDSYSITDYTKHEGFISRVEDELAKILILLLLI